MEWEGNSDERVGWKGTVSSVLETHCCSEQAESHCGKHGLFSPLVGSHSVLGLSNTEKEESRSYLLPAHSTKGKKMVCVVLAGGS